MPQLDEEFQAIIAQGSPATAAGDRVYAMRAPQSSTTLPRITYQRITTSPETSLTGSSRLDSVRIQVDCWAKTFLGAAALGDQVRRLLEADTKFKPLCQAITDFHEPENDLFRRSMDFRCWEHLEG